jgi:hypothetical protein
METTQPIKWYQSKVVGLAIVACLLALSPLITSLADKPTITLKDALEFAIAAAIIIARVWFTNAPVEQSVK